MKTNKNRSIMKKKNYIQPEVEAKEFWMNEAVLLLNSNDNLEPTANHTIRRRDGKVAVF